MQQADIAEHIRVINMEPTDTREKVMEAIGERREPIVIVFPSQLQVRWRPDDFLVFKHLKRQRNMVILFVIPTSENLSRWARERGFHNAVFPTLEQAIPTPQAVVAAPASVIPPLLHTAPVPSTSTQEQSGAFAAIAPAPSSPRQPPSAALRHLIVPHKSEPADLPRAWQNHRVLPRLTPFGGRITAGLLACVVLGGLVLGLRLLRNSSTPAWLAQPATLGQVYFESSSQFDSNNTTGFNDQLVLSLSHLAPPAPGEAYYAWLLGDAKVAEPAYVYVGKLSVQGGSALLRYHDPHHTNLLATFSRLLITEQLANITPSRYSLHKALWRYYGAISSVPNPADSVDHFSLLDHLRHLLAADPKLRSVGLAGGLDIWLYRNTKKIAEWTSAAQGDGADPDALHRMLIRILLYLDGTSVVPEDLPPGMPFSGLVDPEAARVGLLEFNPATDNPPGYIYHIGLHLSSVVISPGVTARQVELAHQIVAALAYVKQELEAVRKDVLQLVALNDQQLQEDSTLPVLDDMDRQATLAVNGSFADPRTGEEHEGVYWINGAMQNLATFDMSVYRDSVEKK